MFKSFKSKVIIVTGSASGLGAAIAIKFDKEGANVVLVDKNEKGLCETKSKCQNSYPINADVTNDSDLQRIITETINKFNRIDVLVNNAGISATASIFDENLIQSFTDNVNVNLRAPIILTKLAAPYLIKSKGNIVNISSIGPQTKSLSPIFSTKIVSKAGLNSFTISAASELAPHGVRVNAISPGVINTNLVTMLGFDLDAMREANALKRISEPEEVADLVLYLASDMAKNMTGSNILADDGFLLRNN